MYNTEDDIHSLLIICSFGEDVWEVGGVSFTASPGLAGMSGQMDAIAGFVRRCRDANGSERNIGSNLSYKLYKHSCEFRVWLYTRDLSDRPIKVWMPFSS